MPALPCAVLRHPPPSLPMVPHVLPENVTPFCTLPKDDDAHDNTDMVTDVANRESQSSSSSPMSRLCLHPRSSNPHAPLTASLCDGGDGGSIKRPLAHGHVGFCAPLSEPTPAECSNASSSA